MNHYQAIDYILKRLQEKLPDNLRYHSIEHTLGVLHSSEYLAKKHGVKGEDLKLLLTAAAYHDSGFSESYKNHEETGCDIAEQVLPQFNYSKEEIDAIKGMIMATKIPQNPKNLIEEIICDADLDYLGGDKYGEISERLYDELGLNGIEMSDDEWLNLQIGFLEKHHYWTDFAKKVLSPKKQLILEKLKRQQKTS